MDGYTVLTCCLLIVSQAHPLTYAQQIYNPDSSMSSEFFSVSSDHSEDINVDKTENDKVVFLRENNTQFVTQVDTTVVFHCPAENVGESSVSWIRRRDYHLLTVGSNIYSSDARFQVRYIENATDWQLHIRYVQLNDAGDYECQISSHPPISLFSHLIVVEATSEILGGPEKFLRIGSSLRLVCILKLNTHSPTHVFWYLNNKVINYADNVKVESSGEISVLFLSNLAPESSGNYSCAPSNAKPSTIHIQVLRGGELPAAIHSRAISTSALGESLKFSFLTSLLSFLHFSTFKPRIWFLHIAISYCIIYAASMS